VALTGAGQTVGLFELDGFYAADVAANFTQAGLPPVSVATVLLDGFNGAPGGSNIEVILDIMMAGYMAPGTNVLVYEGFNPDDVLNRMATDNIARQLSSSWGWSPIDATPEQIFKQMVAQGQSLLQASGDSGAYSGPIMPPADDPNLTVVGGTALTTTGLHTYGPSPRLSSTAEAGWRPRTLQRSAQHFRGDRGSPQDRSSIILLPRSALSGNEGVRLSCRSADRRGHGLISVRQIGHYHVELVQTWTHQAGELHCGGNATDLH
jgi:subtilase family serine protease